MPSLFSFILATDLDGFSRIVLAWIASKVKAVAPVLPSGDVTTSIPSINDEPAPVAGGSMGIPSGDKLTTRRHGQNKKKPKTTTVAVVVVPADDAVVTTSASSVVVVPANDAPDDDASPLSTVNDATKEAIKRVIRAILSRA